MIWFVLHKQRDNEISNFSTPYYLLFVIHALRVLHLYNVVTPYYYIIQYKSTLRETTDNVEDQFKIHDKHISLQNV